MGLYLNPDNQYFKEIVSSGEYIDKSGLISYLNNRIGKPRPYVASSRPRRFGKSLAVKLLAAYYSRGCASREVFQSLEIAADSSFEKHLNKYDVINLDIQSMRSVYLQIKNKNGETVLDYIQSEVLKELKETYSDYIDESCSVIAQALTSINKETGKQFIIIIDEWDCFFREEKNNEKLLNNYIIFMRSLFKGDAPDRFVKLAYITGILPIKKYGTQSALNNFREFTMTSPGAIAKYIGFTEKEVRLLCKEHNMSFSEMQKWYDGYYLSKVGHVYSPNSVMEAIDNGEFENYWSRTETYESLKLYISMDFDGLKQKVVDMLGGAGCKIDVDSFQNDMTTFNSSDDVLTLLIHLGYLGYDSSKQEAFIPNKEVRSAFILAVKNEGWDDVYKAIQTSEDLLSATLSMDEETVAKIIQDVHMKNTSSLVYNDEISLASVIQIAYYSATRDYTLIRELPSGEGFADMVFIPKRRSKKPALLIELKWDKTAKGAIAQIKDRKYITVLKDYKDNTLLVGINYDKKNKKHQCQIEKA